MENGNFTPEDLIQLIYGSEDEKLAKKVLSVYLNQQKEIWEKKQHTLVLDKGTEENLFFRNNHGGLTYEY